MSLSSPSRGSSRSSASGRAARRLVWLLAAAALGACPISAGSYEHASLSVQVSDASGQITELTCTRLPVQWGSRVHTRHRLPNGVDIVVNAWNREARVDLHRPGEPEETLRVVEESTLLAGFSEDVAVGAGDAALTLHLGSGCTP